MPNFTYTNQVINQGHTYLLTAITILMVLMTLWFLWSVFKFIGEKDATKRKDRQKQMVAGLIGLFIAVAVWGIIGIAQRVTGTERYNTPTVVCPPGYRPGVGVTAGTCVRG